MPTVPRVCLGCASLTGGSKGGGDVASQWIWAVLGAAVALFCAFSAYAVWHVSQGTGPTEVETANRKVQEAVEKAQAWLRSGSVAEVDDIERALKIAAANPLATEKGSVVPTLAAVEKMKLERWAAEILTSAVESISQGHLDKAQSLLQMYLSHDYGTERKRAETLSAEIDRATSDSDALHTLLAMDDKTFDAFASGDTSSVVLSHPVLIETRIATLNKNLAEAARVRQQRRKAKEAEGAAEQRRLDDEQEPARAGQKPEDQERPKQERRKAEATE